MDSVNSSMPTMNFCSAVPKLPLRRCLLSRFPAVLCFRDDPWAEVEAEAEARAP